MNAVVDLKNSTVLINEMKKWIRLLLLEIITELQKLLLNNYGYLEPRHFSKFNSSGGFPYFCILRPSMIGNIIVLTKRFGLFKGKKIFYQRLYQFSYLVFRKLILYSQRFNCLYYIRIASLESNKHFNAQAYGFNFLLSLNSASCQRYGNKIFQIFGFKARLRVASYCIASSF